MTTLEKIHQLERVLGTKTIWQIWRNIKGQYAICVNAHNYHLNLPHEALGYHDTFEKCIDDAFDKLLKVSYELKEQYQ